MKYTERDIEKAIRLKLEGYNWIATNKNGRPFAYGRMPYRCADDSNEYNIWDNQPGTPWLMLSKEYFKSITWENEPVYIDEIITGVKVQANGDTAIDRLIAENAELKKRLENAVELPCKVGDTIYEATSVGIYEWEVESIYLCKNTFQANCVNKNDYKMHWTFIKADYCNEFEGNGRVRVNRLEAEARLAELKGGKK